MIYEKLKEFIPSISKMPMPMNNVRIIESLNSDVSAGVSRSPYANLFYINYYLHHGLNHISNFFIYVYT